MDGSVETDEQQDFLAEDGENLDGAGNGHFEGLRLPCASDRLMGGPLV